MKIITANTSNECGNGIYESVLANLQNGAQHYVVVPDRFTLSVEQDLCELQGKGFYNLDVVGFTRLAIKLLDQKSDKGLSKEGTVILLNKIIRENADKLDYYKDIVSYNFSKELFAAIAQLRDSGVVPENIESSLETMDGVTAAKLKDIKLCYEKYLSAINEKYTDTISRIDYLINNSAKTDRVKDAYFYFFGFNVYSEQQLRLIKALTDSGRQTTIAFMYDKWANNHHLYVMHQMEELADYCKAGSIALEKEERTEILPNNFSYIHCNIFGFEKKQYKISSNEDDGKIVLYCEKNPYEEIKAVAREINYLIKVRKYRYKEISIIVPNGQYKRVIDEIFTRFNIPYFTDTKYYVKNTITVKYINACLNAVDNNYTRDDMIKLSHQPFFGFSGEETGEFENYVFKFDINHSQFLKPFYIADFEIAEKVRNKIINTLSVINSRAQAIESYGLSVKKLISDSGILRQIELFANSDDARLQFNGEINDFITVIDEISAVNGSQIISLGDYIAIINSAITDMGKGTLPRKGDCVFVGTTKESRFSKIKALFIIGASGGHFPVLSGDNVIFTLYDNEYMKQSGLKIFPTPMDNNNLERMVVADLASKPKEMLYVGYASSGMDGGLTTPGEGLVEIADLIKCGYISLSQSHSFNDLQFLEYFLVNKENAYFEYMSNNVPQKYVAIVENYLIKRGIYIPKKDDVESGKNYAEFLFAFKEGDYQTSVSQLEKYFGCPFSFYCKYGLGINEREDGKLKVFDIGIMIHKILEIFFKRCGNKIDGMSNLLLRKEIKAAINQVITKDIYLKFGRSGYGKFILDSIVKESEKCLQALSENVKKSLFKPYCIEQTFGYCENDKNLVIKTADKSFNFRGKIDRIDRYKEKIIIIDYKTGSASGTLEDIYAGEKIQLFLYLKPFLDEDITPAMVGYLPIKNNFTKKSNGYTIKGQFLNDVQTVMEMDTSLKLDNTKIESDIFDIKLTIKNNGEVKFYPGKNALCVSDFEEITGYTQRLVQKALAEIDNGYFDKKPYEGKCEFCEYKKMCGEVMERKKVSNKKLDNFKG